MKSSMNYQFTSRHLTLDNLSRSNQGHMTFKRLIDFKGYFQGQKGPIWTFVIYLGQYLRKGACCDQCVYEAHVYTKSYMIFQLTL